MTFVVEFDRYVDDHAVALDSMYKMGSAKDPAYLLPLFHHVQSTELTVQ